MKNKKIHITFIDFDDIQNPLLAAGQAKATYEVGKILTKRGHRVTVLCSSYPGSSDRIEEGIEYKHIGIPTKNIKVNNAMYILFLPFYICFIKSDIIFECFTAPISTLFSPLFTKIPVVAIPTTFNAERFSKLYHLPFWVVEKIGCRFYKYFLPYTKELDNKMKNINPTIVSKIVPEGVGQEYFMIPRRVSKYILFLGRFDMNQKGIDLLLDAYEKFPYKKILPLVIAGFGPDEEKIKKYIKDKKLQKYVRIVGPAYGEKKAELLSHALFITFPSRFEGFSLFSLEALASGIPFVGFDIPGLSWTKENSVLKAKAFDTDEYSKLMEKLSDKTEASRMSQAARKLAQNYTWDKVAAEYEKFAVKIVVGNN